MHSSKSRNSGQKAIKKVCVIGAGVMGQAIAAHMANAGLDCLLLDMPAQGSEKNKVALQAIEKIKVSSPSLIFSKSMMNRIKAGNIDDSLAALKDYDLVIEAIVEKINVKQALFSKINPHLAPDTIVASNTSGLSVEKMIDGLDKSFAERFMVMHFFNPVRYLHLLEIVPSKSTKKELVDSMKRFGEERLGKGIVVGKDTVNFVANRIGVYGMMETIRAVSEDDYTVEEVDAIFGPSLGRPKSAVFRTADVVGLDTLIHVAQNCFDNLPNDECRQIFKVPKFLETMVAQGSLGQKSGQGFYKKAGKDLLALDPKTMTYHDKAKVRFESLGEVRNLARLEEKIKKVAYYNDRAGSLFFQCVAKTCVYAANRVGEIADDLIEIDNALCWGFGWELGPFQTWDAMGVRKSVDVMQAQGIKVPAWVMTMLSSGRETFYTEGAHGKVYAYCPKTKDQKEVSKSPKELTLATIKKEPTHIVEEMDAYTLIDAGNGALVVEFNTKMNAVDNDVLAGINAGIDRCERGEFEALVLANDGRNFSVGANILLIYMGASQKMWGEIDKTVRNFQDTCKRLRYSSIPTVSAPFQLTLGGGCELSMWCDKIFAHAETYIGLVEVGVGLIPGGGGNIEMLDRTLKGAIDSPTFVTELMIMRALETVAMAKVATSAQEAKELLYLKPCDNFSMNRRFLLWDATTMAVAMARTGYIPPARREFRLPGRNGFATFDMGLRSFYEGQMISEHDYKIAKKIAHVMSGGDTNSYQKVSEDYLLDLEREAFLSLCGEAKTLERIAYMLEHNKPLRN